MKKSVKGKKPASNPSPKKTAGNTAPQKTAGNNAPQKTAGNAARQKKAGKTSAKKPFSKKAPVKSAAKKPSGVGAPNRTASAGVTPEKRSGAMLSVSVNAAKKSAVDRKKAKKRTAPVQKPSKPVDKRSRKAADKAVRNKQAAGKRRHRYHGGNYILYYISAGILVVIVLVILANTVLFRCKNITVSGNVRYSAEEVIAGSGLETGANLLHINSKGAAEKVVSALAYVDSASVKKSFPASIEVTVTEAEKRFAVRQGAVTAAVSYGGKIIEQGSFGDLPVVVGMDAESIEIGTWIKSTVEAKNDIPDAILSAVERVSLEGVSEIDITDRFSIKMQLDNGRIILEIGTVSDLVSKLMVAKNLIENYVGEAESVTIIVVNPTKPTLRSNIPNDDPEGSIGEPNEPENSGGNSGDTSGVGDPESSQQSSGG